MSYELNENISNAYMNKAVIEEDRQNEVFGVNHLDKWETFTRGHMGHGSRIELEEFIKDRTGNSYKRVIGDTIEQYAAKIRTLPDEKSLLHIIWAGELHGDGKKIQKDQLLLHFIQSELDRSEINQALFTNFWMRKHNVVSRETYDNIFKSKSYGEERTINTRPYNEPVFLRLPDITVDTRKFNVTLSKSIGDEIENINVCIAEGRFGCDDLGRIKREPGYIQMKSSFKKLFHLPKLSSVDIKRLDKCNYDESYVR